MSEVPPDEPAPPSPSGRVPGVVQLPETGTGERRARRAQRGRGGRRRSAAPAPVVPPVAGEPGGERSRSDHVGALPAGAGGVASAPAAVRAPAPGTAGRPTDPSARRRDRRRPRGGGRQVGVLAVTGLLVVALVALLGFGWDQLRAIDDDPPPPLETTGTSVVPDDPSSALPPRALLVQEGEDGGVVGVTVLVAGPTGAGGAVLFAPAGSMVEVPSFGLNPLREAYELGGLELLEQSTENLLGLVFDASTVVTAAQLVDLVEPAGALAVDLPAAVEVVDEVGRVETLFPAGAVEVEPADVPALLEERGEGNDLERLVRHQAFWTAWLEALEGEPGAAPGPEAAGGVGAVIAGLAAGEVSFDLLPVEVLASGEGPGDDLYAVQGDQLDALVAELAPGAVGVDGERIRVQVLNGTGEPGLAQSVQPTLTPAGAVVSLTGNADRFDYETTQIVFYRDADLEDARAVQRALGVGEVVRSLVVLDVVDVTVVVGADFRASRQATDPTAASTTTTTDPGA